MSNACANGEFFYQTYSPQEPVQVGEDRVKKVFMAQFSFMSKTPQAEQPGLFISVSPDSHEGSRMSWVGLQDTTGGIQVSVNDTPDVDGAFVSHEGPLLDRSRPHTIRFWIKVNPGIDNDLVRIFVDGVDLGQCFTTWENYYRTSPEQAPPPNVNTPADINSLQFCSSVPGPPGLATSGGYLFDNVSITPSDGPGPPGCDDVIDKKADQQTVRPGGLAGYQITVRNRGSGSDRNVQVCDRVPRRMTFVRADRKLRRVGGRRCLVIPRLRPGQRVGLHVEFRVDASAPPGGGEHRRRHARRRPAGYARGAGSRPAAGRARGAGSETGALGRAGGARGGQEGQGRRDGPAKARSTELHRIASVAPPSPSPAQCTRAMLDARP
jgi:uncharacterized repeat protein (TIGR01451 family)